jgi:hypothetical protein
MNRLLFPGIAGACLLAACANHHPQPATPVQDTLTGSDTSSTLFFPVVDYLRSEIRHIDSLPVALKRYTTRQGKKDSAFISVAEFNALAEEFLTPDLGDSYFKKHYTEASFVDNTTGTITFTYSTADKNLPIQRVDVVTVPGTRSSKVKSIYLEKIRTAGDSATLQKLYWNSRRDFQIVSMVRIKGGNPEEQLTSVVWGDNEDD